MARTGEGWSSVAGVVKNPYHLEIQRVMTIRGGADFSNFFMET
jgi:hypothetical protein